jgi:uncharacterized protein YerC
MPHVSKQKVSREVREKIARHLSGTLTRLRGQAGNAFLSEFFTSTEQMMLAKRLAVIFFLSRDFSAYRIKRLLKVSPSTVARIKVRMALGKYEAIVALTKGASFEGDFLKIIGFLLGSGLPPRGRGRWKWLHELR